MSAGDTLFIFGLVALNGFFVAVEISVVAARRARLDPLENPGSTGLRLLRRWLEDDAAREKIIATAQFGTILTSLALGATGVIAVRDWIAQAFTPLTNAAQQPETVFYSLQARQSLAAVAPSLLALAIIATIQVVLGVQIPKVTALYRPERFAAASAPLMRFFAGLFRVFIIGLDGLTRGVCYLLGIPSNGHAHTSSISVDDLREMVSGTENNGTIDPPEREMLSAVIDFSSLVARQVSVPRTEIVAVQANTSIDEAARAAMQHGVTKLPVYESTLDQITGILHLKDLLPALLADKGMQNRSARQLARDALFVPESIPVSDLLVQMRLRRQHIAITLDEYGGTAGLVTLEDLLEQIVGDVRDPFDVHLPDIQPLSDGAALLDGMVLIEEFNQMFGSALYDPDYDTIAGYVLGRLGRIAQIGDVVEDADNGFRLRVESMDRLRIARIHLSRISTESPAKS